MPLLDERTRLERKLARAMGRAAHDFSMIAEGDRILCAVSGGKDSYTLHHLLMDLRGRAPVSFEVIAVNIDQGHPGYPGERLTGYMRERGYPFRMVREDTYSIVTEKVPAGKTYCSLCSRLRRGILYRISKEMGCTKIALGHHRDDAIATLMLNLVFAGQLSSMPPKLLSDDGESVVIRPLIYCAEDDIARYSELLEFPILPCDLCGSQDGLERKAIAGLLSDLEKRHPGARSNMLAALGNVRPSHLLDVGLWAKLGVRQAREESGEGRAPIAVTQLLRTPSLATSEGRQVLPDDRGPLGESAQAQAGARGSMLAWALRVVTSPILLTGVYAWSVAVSPSVVMALAHAEQAGYGTRAGLSAGSGLGALGFLAAGVLLERAGSMSAATAGIWGFLGAALGAWLLFPPAIEPGRIDALRGALGAGGFALYALSWGVPDVFRRLLPEDNPRADTSVPLESRDHLPRAAVAVAAIGIVGASAVEFLGWSIHEPARAMLGHSIAGLCGVALVTGAAEVAVGRRGYVPPPPKARMERAALALAILGLLGLLGLAWTAGGAVGYLGVR